MILSPRQMNGFQMGVWGHRVTFRITFLGGLAYRYRGLGILCAQTWMLAWNVAWGLYSKLHPSSLVCRLPAAGLCWFLASFLVLGCFEGCFSRSHAKPVWMVIARSLDQALAASTWLLKCLSVEPCCQLNSYIKCCLPNNHFTAMSVCEELG